MTFIADVLAELKTNFRLTDEGTLQRVLGISIQKLQDEKIVLSQPGLIRIVIHILGLDNSNPSPTSTTNKLYKDEDGKEREYFWNYREVVGILSYISQNTRPDITFVVS